MDLINLDLNQLEILDDDSVRSDRKRVVPKYMEEGAIDTIEEHASEYIYDTQNSAGNVSKEKSPEHQSPVSENEKKDSEIKKECDLKHYTDSEMTSLL